MRHRLLVISAMLATAACGGAQSGGSTGQPAQATAGGAGPASGGPGGTGAGEPGGNEFKVNQSDPSTRARGVEESKIKATRTEAAIRFKVVDKDKGPIEGVVISLTAPDGVKYYTEETDAEGFSEVLVPVGKKYDLVYLSLGRKDISAKVPVSDEPNQNINLTLRYKSYIPPARPQPKPGAPPIPDAPRFVLKGVHFDTGKASLRDESREQLDTVVEYMTHKKSARVEISGHTDNVGNPKGNKALSEKRAKACREYLMSRGIDGDRVEAVGYGDELPIAPNDTEEGRQKNRRIEATEL